MPSSRRVRKRTIVEDEHNDEDQKQDEEHDDDEDSSPSPPKVARLDQNHDIHDHTNESTDPVEQEEEEEATNSDMDNDDEEQEQMAPRRINLSGKPAETGIIKKICVENFMCHRKLTVELCPNGTRLLHFVSMCLF